MQLEEIAKTLEAGIRRRISQSGMMCRIFSRVKSVESLRHKMEMKGEKYRSGKGKIQDMIGVRIVLYFPDDVEAVSVFMGSEGLVGSSIDEHGLSTFCPQRLNMTKSIPEELAGGFRLGLPEEFAPYIDTTYEVQIRTIFSEGWHEVEHDMRYKCKADWEGCEQSSRTLNGMIATLETVEWGMKSLFQEMARRNQQQGNWRAMLRNMMRIRFADADFSPRVKAYLDEHPQVAIEALSTDRVVFLISLLNSEESVPLTYDNVLFRINRIDIHDEGLERMESDPPQPSQREGE